MPAAAPVVLGRAGVDGELQTAPTLTAARRRVGTETRLALSPDTVADWILHVPDEASSLYVSFAAADLAEDEQASFRIEQQGVATPLLAEAVAEAEARWHDREVMLAPGRGRVLTFTATRQAQHGNPSAALLWGSVGVVGERRAGGAPPAVQRPPNIILVSLDTLGARHLGFHGARPSPSPFLDDLLGRSRTFMQAYAPYPNTLVTHASLFTGLYPRAHGLYGGLHNDLEPETLALVLARHGYRTAAITEDTYVSSDFGFDRGFDSYENGSTEIRPQFLGDAKTTFAAAADWLRRRSDAAPYFLFVHTYEVHKPYLVRDRQVRNLVESLNPGYQGEFARYYPGLLHSNGHNAGQKLLSAADLEQLGVLYAGEISYLDRQLRTFLDEVATLSPMEETLVVLFSDHGEEFGEHGFVGHGETLHDPVLHVVLAFHWAGRLGAGRVDEVVSLVDVMPTVLELAGIAPAPGLDGASLAAALRGEEQGAPARPVFAELKTVWGGCLRQELPIDCPVDMLAVRTPEWKMITAELPPSMALYDLISDPGESRNVADEHPVERGALAALLRDYRAGAALPSAVGDTARPEIDESTRERLRALGYLQ